MEIKINGFFKVEQGFLSLPLVKEAPAIQTLSRWRIVFASLFKGGVVAVLEKESKCKVYVLKRDMARACGLVVSFKVHELQAFIESVKNQADEAERIKAKVRQHDEEIEQAKIRNRKATAAFLLSQKLISEQGPKSPEALALLEEAAEANHIQALYQLGNHYKFKDPEKARSYFQRAANLGHQPSLKKIWDW